MAISPVPQDPQPVDEITLKITNGDFAAMSLAMETWNFKDYESMLKFAVATLLRAENNRVYIDQDGIKTNLEPNANLLKPKDQE